MLSLLEFKYPANILYLALAVIAVVFFILSFGKKKRILALLHIGQKLRFKALRVFCLCAGLGMMVFALMGPQVFSGYAQTGRAGLDIYVLVDTSRSMLVPDIAPDRMTVAKRVAENLLDRLDGDRVGFIPFASGAYIQMPLTDDYQLARMFLSVIDTDMMSGGGTNMAGAIQLAGDSFKRASGADRVLLIISDGEEHGNDSLRALKGVMDDSLRVFTVGVGTEHGGEVPEVFDKAGNPAVSRLNAGALEELARAGNGAYYQATFHGAEISSLLEDLSALKRDVLAGESVKRFRLLFQYFLAPGILLVLLAWFLPERREPE